MGISAPSPLPANLPQLPDPHVPRSHIVSTLSQLASSDAALIILDSAEGMGATTLLTEFCHENANQTFPLFINPASKFSYSVDYLRVVLAEQFYTYLTGKNIEADSIDPQNYSTLLLRLKTRSRIVPRYFVVDGLNQIPIEDERIIEIILRELLPLGVDGFRFIIACAPNRVMPYLKSVRHKVFHMVPLSPPESKLLLGKMGLNDEHAREFEKICRGNPSHIRSIMRLLQSGIQPDEILNSTDDAYPDFVSMEFSSIDGMNNDEKAALATLAYSSHPLTKTELSDTSGVGVQVIEQIIKKVTFLATGVSQSPLEFVSEAHRRIAQARLLSYRDLALKHQVEHLLKNPRSATAIRLLPSYQQSLGLNSEIIDSLSPNHYAGLLDITHSVTSLRARALIGSKCAKVLGAQASIFQFSLQRSLFSTIAGMGGLRSEVSALVSLGEGAKALEVAAKSLGRENRLTLLSEYARRVCERNESLSTEVRQQIKELAESIDVSDLGPRAFLLAENLLFVDPDLAIKIIEETSKGPDKVQHRDAAFAYLSISASLSEFSEKSSLNERTKSRIGDEKLQDVLASFNSSISDISIQNISRTLNAMEPVRRIYFLRKLTMHRSAAPAIIDVVDYAMDQMIACTEYQPKAGDFADLSTALPKSDQRERILALIKRMEGQLGLVSDLSLTRDIVRLQINFAHAESNFDEAAALSRIESLFIEILDLKGVEVRVECFSMLLRALRQTPPLEKIAKPGKLESQVACELKLGLDELLSGSADQLDVIRFALRAICHHDPNSALSIAKRLNVLRRRDSAFSEIAQVLVRLPDAKDIKSFLDECLNSVQDDEVRNGAILGCFAATLNGDDAKGWLEPLEFWVNQVSDPVARATGIISTARLRNKLGLALLGDIEQRFRDSVELVDSLYQKVDLAFEFATVISPTSKERALVFFEEANAQRGHVALRNSDQAEMIQYCLALLSSLFRLLSKGGLLTDHHLKRFSKLVDQIPCAATRAHQYSSLAEKLACEGKLDLCKSVVVDYCIPLVGHAQAFDASLHRDVCATVFPAAYCVVRSAALAMLSDLTVDNRALAIVTTAFMKMRKVARSESWPELADGTLRITHEECLEILELASLTPNDGSFYSIVSMLSKTICNRASRDRITGSQRVDVADRLKKLITTKLPDPVNIVHDGYSVASLGRALAIRQVRARDFNGQAWNSLLTQARLIPNIADKCLVLLELAESLPDTRGASPLRLEIMREARDLIKELPAVLDRYSRLQGFVEIALHFDANLAKQAVLDAANMLETCPDALGGAHRRKLVDLAEQIEPGFGERVADRIGDDPARARAKREAKEQAAIQKLRRSLANGEDLLSDSLVGLPSAAWKNVGALRAGRQTACAPEKLTKYVDVSATLDLEMAYPVLAWYVENIGERGQRDLSRLILPIADAVVLSGEVAITVLEKMAAIKRPTSFEVFDRSGPLVRRGERGVAFDIIGEWLAEAAPSRLIICDCYFSPSDIGVLKLVLSANPSCEVIVLTSTEVVPGKEGYDSGDFLREWQLQMDQEAPPTEIVSVGSHEDSKTVIHDRWLLADESALSLGTSLNSVGLEKLSAITRVAECDFPGILQGIERYVRRERVVDERRVRYLSFTL